MQLRNKTSQPKETPEKKSVEKQKAPTPVESASKQLSKKKTKLYNEHNIQGLTDMANLLRVHSVEMTNKAGSGHPTSCGSCADFISVLFFDQSGMHYDPKNPANFANDRFVLSKGHAAPILYAAWARAGFLKYEDLDTLRSITSKIEGHPTPDQPFVDVATGSLGQGLGAACGMAYSSKYFDKINNTYFCLMGDGEIAEGSVWEAANFASQYKLDNLIAIVDANKFGQSNELGHPVLAYKKRFEEFGWFAQSIDGHDVASIVEAFEKARNSKDKPSVIIGKTFKGHNYGEGIEDNMKFHGKPLGADAQKALDNLKKLIQDPDVKLTPTMPDFEADQPKVEHVQLDNPTYELDKKIATREAYGNALKKLGKKYSFFIGLDADLKNSTFSEQLFKEVPEQFVECFISEQNMISVATGITARCKITFSSTFAAFFSRAYDQIRMGGISKSPLNFCGSHAGCSIGEDGASQMGLEDITIFRAIPNSLVLYPTDAVSTEKAVILAANYNGMAYIRTCRLATEVLYKNEEIFEIGKCKVLQKSESDKVCLVAAGVTVYECKKAAEKLKAGGINVSIVDIFSVKPLDYEGILQAAQAAGNIIITVEDHYKWGGIFEAVSGAFSHTKDVRVYGISVTEVPKSGKSLELFDYCKIGAKEIEHQVHEVLKH